MKYGRCLCYLFSTKQRMCKLKPKEGKLHKKSDLCEDRCGQTFEGNKVKFHNRWNIYRKYTTKYIKGNINGIKMQQKYIVRAAVERNQWENSFHRWSSWIINFYG